MRVPERGYSDESTVEEAFIGRIDGRDSIKRERSRPGFLLLSFYSDIQSNSRRLYEIVCMVGLFSSDENGSP